MIWEDATVIRMFRIYIIEVLSLHTICCDGSVFAVVRVGERISFVPPYTLSKLICLSG